MTMPAEDEKSLMDFAPFDPLANLEAVTEVVKTIRHLSWTYAGDVARVAIKIGKTFYAGRCVVCVCSQDGIEVYEYAESHPPQKKFLESKAGQDFLLHCLELAPECLALSGDTERGAESLPKGLESIDLSKLSSVEIPEQLLNPTSYVFPLRHQYEKQHVVKPGLLLIQEPTGLTRWNKRFLDSVVVVAEYLAMVIECERLYTLVNTPPSTPEEEE